jgi:hypothetical protein
MKVSIRATKKKSRKLKYWLRDLIQTICRGSKYSHVEIAFDGFVVSWFYNRETGVGPENDKEHYEYKALGDISEEEAKDLIALADGTDCVSVCNSILANLGIIGDTRNVQTYFESIKSNY